MKSTKIKNKKLMYSIVAGIVLLIVIAINVGFFKSSEYNKDPSYGDLIDPLSSNSCSAMGSNSKFAEAQNSLDLREIGFKPVILDMSEHDGVHYFVVNVSNKLIWSFTPAEKKARQLKQINDFLNTGNSRTSITYFIMCGSGPKAVGYKWVGYFSENEKGTQTNFDW